MADKNEVGYCGIKCGICIMGNEKTPVLAAELLSLMKGCVLETWQEKVPRDEDFSYKDMEKGLKWLKKYMNCPGCHAGGGDPKCKIRKCAVEKGVENCGACAELPCATIEEWKAQGIDIEKNFK